MCFKLNKLLLYKLCLLIFFLKSVLFVNIYFWYKNEIEFFVCFGVWKIIILWFVSGIFIWFLIVWMFSCLCIYGFGLFFEYLLYLFLKSNVVLLLCI